MSFPLEGEMEMQSKPHLGFDGSDSFESEHKLLCHVLMTYKLCCGTYILPLKQI